jgi:hypothetical protein
MTVIERDFAISPPGKGARFFLLAVGLLAPPAMLLVMAYAQPPPESWPLLFLAVALLPATMGVAAWAMHRRSLQISDAGLRVRRFPWPRIVPWSELDLAAARTVNLDERTELRPGFKIAGARLPGFRSGWFRLHDGRRAYVVLTDWRRAVELPRKDGRTYLFSLPNPDAFLQSLPGRPA